MPPQLWQHRLACVALALASLPAGAQNALEGKRLYLDVGRIRGAGVSCVDCHFALPGVFGISAAANDPARLARAVDNVPQMSPLRGRLSSTDFADLAAYIGRPDVPSPLLQLSAGGAASDRIDFGSVPAGATGSSRLIVSNTGAVALRLTSAPRLIGPQAADFAIASTTCAGGNALAAGGDCSVDLRFAPLPGASGGRAASLQIDHDWVGGTAAVALLGQAAGGVSAAAAPVGGGGAAAVLALLALGTAATLRGRWRAIGS